MMKCRVVKSYTDKNSGQLVHAGMVIEISSSRLDEINAKGDYLVKLDGIKGTPSPDTVTTVKTAPKPTTAKRPKKAKKG